MSSLLPTDRRKQSFSILTRRQPFEILYRLNCDNLCADFQEDLEFRFSWGVTSLISRFVLGNTRHQMTLKNYPSQVSDYKNGRNLINSTIYILRNTYLRFHLPHLRRTSGILKISLLHFTRDHQEMMSGIRLLSRKLQWLQLLHKAQLVLCSYLVS